MRGKSTRKKQKELRMQTLEWIRINGRKRDRIRFGEETKPLIVGEEGKCSCGVQRGMYHRSSCIWEQCPGCNGVAVECSCEYWIDK